MSTFSQNPEHEPLTVFDELTLALPLLTAWQAMFDEAEEMLRAAKPEGFDVLDIGRAAFDSLPESEREAALDELFYAFWAAREHDRALREAREERAA